MVSQTLIEKAKEFHGHICPFLILGLRASEIAMKRLGVKKADEAETVGEEILAIVECNNCFTDGVQIATGCTIGNNALIYLDLGKNALTLLRRGDWKGVRVYIDAEKLRKKYFSREALELFDKVVAKRAGNAEDVEKLRKMWEKIGYSVANLGEEEFKIEEVRVKEIERAPIFESLRCDNCGELAMATRVSSVDGKNICLGCQGECEAVVGRGIERFKIPYMK